MPAAGARPKGININPMDCICHSSEFKITMIFKGSNFGPLIWNIYQNDLVNNIRNSNITIYTVRPPDLYSRTDD